MAKPQSRRENWCEASKANKVIVPYEEANPDTEPLFVNNFDISRFGSDIFVDLGITPVEDLKGGKRSRFIVLSRLAMSKDSFVAFFEQARTLAEKLKEEE